MNRAEWTLALLYAIACATAVGLYVDGQHTQHQLDRCVDTNAHEVARELNDEAKAYLLRHGGEAGRR